LAFVHTPPPEIYTLSLHDALPICVDTALDRVTFKLDVTLAQHELLACGHFDLFLDQINAGDHFGDGVLDLNTGVHLDKEELAVRSEEHTSELQSRENLVCRLLLEK